MPIYISITQDKAEHPIRDWEKIQIKDLAELHNIIKTYPYSNANFYNGYRKADNITSFNNLLIYDIDNNKDMPNLTIKQAEILLAQNQIHALIMPTKSNNKEKNGYIAQRYRILIPTATPHELKQKDEFRIFQELCAKQLGIMDYLDKSALNDMSRFYYTSPISESGRITNGKIFDTRALEQQAGEIAKQKELEKRQREATIREIQANQNSYRQIQPTKQQDKYLSFVPLDKYDVMINYDIQMVVEKNESCEIYKDTYTMIRTADSKYAVIPNANLIHDFRSGKTYNVYTYLSKFNNTNNVNAVARRFQELTGEEIIQANHKLILDIISEACDNGASKDKELEIYIKEKLGVKYVKFHYGSGESFIEIADVRMSLNEYGTDIIKRLKENREKDK